MRVACIRCGKFSRRSVCRVCEGGRTDLRRWLDLRGVTIEQLSEMCGVHWRTIYRAAEGRPIAASSALSVSRYTGLDAHRLTIGRSEPLASRPEATETPGGRVAAARERAMVRQEDLAERIGTSRRTVIRIEQDRAPIGMRAAAIAEALGVDAGWLVKGDRCVESVVEEARGAERGDDDGAREAPRGHGGPRPDLARNVAREGNHNAPGGRADGDEVR